MEALQNIYDKIKNEKHAATIFTGDYKKSFWIAFQRIVNTKKQTYIPPIEIGVYIYMTFCERLIYSMNVLSMTMVSYYLHTSPRQTNPFLISLSLRNKLLILFPSVMQTNVKGMIISRWRYSRYVTRKLLSLCKLFFKNVYLLEHFPTFGSMLIFSISMLPICGKILEKIIFDNVYVF